MRWRAVRLGNGRGASTALRATAMGTAPGGRVPLFSSRSDGTVLAPVTTDNGLGDMWWHRVMELRESGLLSANRQGF